MLETRSGDDIQLSHIEQALQVGSFETQEVHLDSAKQSEAKLSMHASRQRPKSRLARIKKLQVQIAADAYQVQAVALAESMLNNETHFVESSVERH